MRNNFIVIVPVYNAKEWIGECLDSILSQDYKNFKTLVIDDHSTDGTWNIIKEYNTDAIRNRERSGALYNIVKGINTFGSRDDIIVTVDGDDKLSGPDVLSYLNDIYNEDVWITYGSFLPKSGRYSDTCQDLGKTHTVNEAGEWIYKELSPETYREGGVWVTSHLRTFRKWLFQNIKNEDLKIEGEYFKMAWDLAFMYPMIEMAGKHIHYIEKILYIYNDLNPNSDGTIDPVGQVATGTLIKQRPKYTEL